MKVSLFKKSAGFFIAIALALMVFAGVFTGISSSTTAHGATLSGAGTADNPYLIQSASDLDSLRNYVGPTYRGKEFKLTKSLNLSAYTQWNPIGTGANANTAFQGNFNGDGYTIDYINIERPNVEYQGLFGSVYYGTIRNVGIGSNSTIIGGNTTGGIVAYLNNGNVVNSYNKAMVGIQRIWNDPGGIVGTATNYSHIEGCYNAGHINGEVAGGIVGTLSAWSSISNSFNTGKVTGLTNDSWTPNTRLMVGGIVGYLQQSSISHCYNTGKVERFGDKSFDMGGLVGNINDTNHSALGAGLYFDVEKSGVEYGVYASTNPMYAKNTDGARTTAQMLQKSTYTAYDFEGKWYMKDGAHMPLLRGLLDFKEQIQPNKLSYTVTFSGNGGKLLSGQEVQDVYEGEAAVPPTYIMDGYAHDGFDGGDHTNVRSNLVLTSKWKKNAYTVTYQYAGGTYVSGAGQNYGTYMTQAVTYGADAEEPVLTRPGYTFLGWDKSSKYVTGNTTITAIWTQGGYNYRFEANGGTLGGGADTSGYVAVGSTIPAFPTAVREDYTFLDWSRSFSGDTLVLTAVWGNNPTVTYNLDGGTSTGGVLKQTIPYGGDATTPSNPKKTGFDFAGWDKSDKRIISDTTVTALWTVSVYKVTFQSGGGTFVAGETIQYVEYGKAAVAPIFQKEGAMFKGWDADFSVITADIFVTANWETNFYEVEFNGNGGEWDYNSHPTKQTIAHGAAAEAPRFTRDGYVFIGWSKAYNNITESTVIYAQWEVRYLEVRFNGNGGTMLNGDTSKTYNVEYAGSILTPEFTKEGYTLSGWKVSGSDTTYSIGAVSAIKSHMVLDAQWIVAEHTVTLQGNGGVTSKGETYVNLKVLHGLSLKNVPAFYREGYEFTGWNASFDNITSSQTIVAQWKFKPLAPNVAVTTNPDGSLKLEAAGLPEIEGVTYTYQWEKLIDGIWQRITGATGKTIFLMSGEDYSDYRVVVGIEGLTPAPGTTGPEEDGYTSGEDSYTDPDGKSLTSPTGTSDNRNRTGLDTTQKIIITIAVIVGILLLLLIIILVARSISRERQKSNNQWY